MAPLDSFFSAPTSLGSASWPYCLFPLPPARVISVTSRYSEPLLSSLSASLVFTPTGVLPCLSPLLSAPFEHLSRPLPASLHSLTPQSSSFSLLHPSRCFSSPLLQIPSPNLSLKPVLFLSFSFPISPIFSPIAVCHSLLPHVLPILLPCSLHFCTGLNPPSRGELRDRGSGRRPPLPSCSGENGLAEKGRRRGRGRWEHTGSVGPFKGSFMGWREAETKRPRRRDTERASLGGDTQTEQAGGNHAQG